MSLAYGQPGRLELEIIRKTIKSACSLQHKRPNEEDKSLRSGALLTLGDKHRPTPTLPGVPVQHCKEIHLL